jgi:hypothetical protein
VDVEGVASRSTPRPAGARQLLAAHDRAEATEERLHEPRLHGRERDPGVLEAEDPVVVELGNPMAVLDQAGVERVDPRGDVSLLGGNADPVLEAVGDGGRRGASGDEQEPGSPLRAQLLAPFGLEWPAHQHDVHVGGR